MNTLIAQPSPPCRVCGGSSTWLDVVDFHKACNQEDGQMHALSGHPVYYAICSQCQFTWAESMVAWTEQEFLDRVYNKDYVLVDPDYVQARPLANANLLKSTFGQMVPSIRHLDYGGGNGVLSANLCASGWQSVSYDPFPDKPEATFHAQGYNLITAFEVFEHVPDPHVLIQNLKRLMANPGLVIFSTLLSDGHLRPGQRINWWYCSPRNGHISMYSSTSLKKLAHQHGLEVASFSTGLHVMWNQWPSFARHLLAEPKPNTT